MGAEPSGTGAGSLSAGGGPGTREPGGGAVVGGGGPRSAEAGFGD